MNTSKVPSSSKNSLTDTKRFFTFFSSMKENPKREEFETEPEYKIRMSKRVDTSMIVLLAVTEIPKNESKNFKYDIDSGRLTIGGGRLQDYVCDSYKVSKATPIIIQTDYQDMESYVATNAFGKAVTVRKYSVFDYVINITNIDFIPDSIFDRITNSFSLSIYRPPQQAKKLSKSVVLAVAVRPIDYQRSNYERIYTKTPTIDDPHEETKINCSFDARLTRIFLYEQSSKQILANYNVNKDSSITFRRETTFAKEVQKDTIEISSEPESDDIAPPDFVPFDTEPIPQQKVDPIYPEIAKRAQVEGNVFLKLWVDKNGIVRQAVVLKSDAEIFNIACMDAAKQWTFKPAYSQGKPIAVWITLPFTFRLPD